MPTPGMLGIDEFDYNTHENDLGFKPIWEELDPYTNIEGSPSSRSITPETIEKTKDVLYFDHSQGSGGGGGGAGSSLGAEWATWETKLDEMLESYKNAKVQTLDQNMKRIDDTIKDEENKSHINQRRVTSLKKQLEIKEKEKLAIEDFVIKYKQTFSDPAEKFVFKRTYKFMYDEERPTVTRFGIVPSLAKHLGGIETHGVLHKIEFFEFFAAWKFLTTKKPTIDKSSSSEYKENIALCDIFERTKGHININPNGIPKTHTIVLWKVGQLGGKEIIILLDPNNEEFSNFISKENSEGLKALKFDIKPNVDLEPHIPNLFYDRTPTKQEPGRETTNPRDCIDIAVKMAFEIQELQLKSTNYKDISKELQYKMSTTYTKDKSGKSHKYLEKINHLKFMREAHSSDKQTREEFSAFYKYHKFKKSMAGMNPAVYEGLFGAKF